MVPLPLLTSDASAAAAALAVSGCNCFCAIVLQWLLQDDVSSHLLLCQINWLICCCCCCCYVAFTHWRACPCMLTIAFDWSSCLIILCDYSLTHTQVNICCYAVHSFACLLFKRKRCRNTYEAQWEKGKWQKKLAYKQRTPNRSRAIQTHTHTEREWINLVVVKCKHLSTLSLSISC